MDIHLASQQASLAAAVAAVVALDLYKLLGNRRSISESRCSRNHLYKLRDISRRQDPIGAVVQDSYLTSLAEILEQQ